MWASQYSAQHIDHDTRGRGLGKNHEKDVEQVGLAASETKTGKELAWSLQPGSRRWAWPSSGRHGEDIKYVFTLEV